MTVRASISPHADPPSEWGPWTINFRAPAGQTEPASPWNHCVGVHAQAPLATTPEDSRIFKESSCFGAWPCAQKCLSGGVGVIGLAKQAGGQHVMRVLNRAIPPPPPPGAAVVVDSPFFKKKKNKNKKSQNCDSFNQARKRGKTSNEYL